MVAVHFRQGFVVFIDLVFGFTLACFFNYWEFFFGLFQRADRVECLIFDFLLLDDHISRGKYFIRILGIFLFQQFFFKMCFKNSSEASKLTNVLFRCGLRLLEWLMAILLFSESFWTNLAR